MVSTSSRSIVTLATSRKNSARPPLADDVDVLGDVRAEEQHLVGAVLAFDGVVAVARVPLEDVVAGAEEGDVVAVVAEHEVVAVAGQERVGALAAEQRVVARAGIDRELDDAGRQGGGGDLVVAIQRVDDQRVVRPLGVGNVDLRPPGPAPRPSVPAPTTSTMSSPLVPLAITTSAAPSPAVPPIVAARLTLTSVTSVPERSFTVSVSVPPRALRSMASTSSRSMTMLPRLRVNSTRPPLAEAAKISSPALPLNSMVSVPSWPSTVSLPSPGSHWNTSSPAPRKAVSLPCWPSTKSLPSPPRRRSTPLLPEDGVVARAAIDRDADQRGEVAGRREAVVAATHVELELLGGADVDGERRRIEPIEAHARAVGGDGEDLGATAAIDLRGVAAGAALEQVGVVARVPDHAVVAALAEHLVVGIAAGQHVVAGAAEQEVEAALAQQGVVAGLAEQLVVARTACEVVVVRAAEQGCRGQRTEAFIERDDVVVVQAEGLDERGVRDRRRAADHGNRAAIDQNVARSVAAERDRVAQSIAEHRQDARRRIEARRDCHGTFSRKKRGAEDVTSGSCAPW